MKEEGSDYVMWLDSNVGGGRVLPPIHYFISHPFCEGVSLNRTVKPERTSQNPNRALCFLLSPLLSLLPFDCCLLCREQRMEWAGCEEDRDRKIIGVFHVSENCGNWWFSGQRKGYLKSKSYYSGALGRISSGVPSVSKSNTPTSSSSVRTLQWVGTKLNLKANELSFFPNLLQAISPNTTQLQMQMHPWG